LRKTSLLLLCLSLVTVLPLAAAEPFAILSITPAAGGTGGGTRVTIKTNGIPNCPILPPAPGISFGGIQATNVEIPSGDTIIVTAPPHAPGPVDVQLVFCGAEPATATNGFTYRSEDAPFAVLGISPTSGSVEGGTDVTVRVDHIPFCFDPVPGPGLSFNGIEATNVVEDYDHNTVTGTTPPHAVGVVDVEVRTCGGPSVTLPGAFQYVVTADPPDTDYETILFPVLYNGPGAQGSEWTTRITVTNDSLSDVDTRSPLFPSIEGCTPLLTGSDLAPFQTTFVCVQTFSHPAGLLFYPRKRFAEDLKFGSRIGDISRATQNAGTEVPVVRERDFRRRIGLLDVPVTALYRTALRVYDPDRNADARVSLRITKANDPLQVIVQTVLTLSAAPEPGDFPLRPGFVMIPDLLATYPALASETLVQIELQTLEPNRRIWAMASAANNNTQLVTIVSPQ
jgi:hypothetical protein